MKSRKKLRLAILIVLLLLCVGVAIYFAVSYSQTYAIGEMAKDKYTEITMTDFLNDPEEYQSVEIPEGYRVVKALFNIKNVTENDYTFEKFHCFVGDTECEALDIPPDYETYTYDSIPTMITWLNAEKYFLVPEDVKDEDIKIVYTSNPKDKMTRHVFIPVQP